MLRTVAFTVLLFAGLVAIGGGLPALPDVAPPASAGIVCIEDLPTPCCVEIGVPGKDPIVSWCG